MVGGNVWERGVATILRLCLVLARLVWLGGSLSTDVTYLSNHAIFIPCNALVDKVTSLYDFMLIALP